MRIFGTVIGALIGLCLVTEAPGPHPVHANEPDMFQAINNYLMHGNPRTKQVDGMTSRIFDRENCVSGAEDDYGGTIKIYWNNVVPEAIELGYTYFEQFDRDAMTLSISGFPYVVDFQLQNPVYRTIYLAIGITNGKNSALALPMDGMNMEIVKKAMKVLYSDHCAGLDAESFFE